MSYAEPRERACMDCGAAFMASAPSSKRCPTCQRAHVLAVKRDRALAYYYAHATPPPARACPRCGRTFQPRSRKQLYCCERCEARASGERWRRRHGKPARVQSSPIVSAITKRRAPAPAPCDWMRQVERDMQITDPSARFAASRAWTPQMRAYARKLALRALGWRGGAY